MCHSMAPNANNVIRYVDMNADMDPGRLIFDPELNQLIDPWRLIRPKPIRCGRAECSHLIAYWALSSTDARVIPAPRRRLKKDSLIGRYSLETQGFPTAGSRTTGGDYDLLYPGLHHTGRFAPYIEYANGMFSTASLLKDQ